jgi:hypothetical protein
MIFESEYRRQAMEKWDQSKEETIAEVKQDWINFLGRISNTKKWLKDAGSLLPHTKKKHT